MSDDATHDINGIPYATKANTSVGDILVCDDGFTCLRDHAERLVQVDSSEELWIVCSDGKHFLEGQLNNANCYVGLYHKRDCR